MFSAFPKIFHQWIGIHVIMGTINTCIVITMLIPFISGQFEGDVRLMPEESDYNFVQVYHDSQWGAVCSGQQWDRNDGDVICRQLGLGRARYVFTAYGRDSNSVYNSVNVSQGEPIWLADLQCNGNEDRVAECERPIEWGSRSPICYRAGIECSKAESESYRYIGCYNDNLGGEPLLKGYGCNVNKDPRCHEFGCLNRCVNSLMTVELCANICCDEFKYFGLEFRNECYCGQTNVSYYMYGQSSDDNCVAPCNGNSSQNCGSNQEISLYECGPTLMPDILEETKVSDATLPPLWGSSPSNNGHFLKPIIMYLIIGGVIGIAIMIIIVYAVYMRKSNQSHMRQIGDISIYCEPDHIQLPNGTGNVEKYLEAEYNFISERQIIEEKEHMYKATLLPNGAIAPSIVRTSGSEPNAEEEGAIGYASVAADCKDDEYCVPIIPAKTVVCKEKKPVAPPRQSSLEKGQRHTASNDPLYAQPKKLLVGLPKKTDSKIEYYATSDVVTNADENEDMRDYRYMSSLTDTGYTKLDDQGRVVNEEYAHIKD
ncbi:uncharacterized protein [Antedon mediterranea]|uniref:uncharacterized protein n=1 Tax=Antedon mediterranea TaxID=105859 RepID=UPI003AF8FFE6